VKRRARRRWDARVGVLRVSAGAAALALRSAAARYLAFALSYGPRFLHHGPLLGGGRLALCQQLCRCCVLRALKSGCGKATSACGLRRSCRVTRRRAAAGAGMAYRISLLRTSSAFFTIGWVLPRRYRQRGAVAVADSRWATGQPLGQMARAGELCCWRTPPLLVTALLYRLRYLLAAYTIGTFCRIAFLTPTGVPYCTVQALLFRGCSARWA